MLVRTQAAITPAWALKLLGGEHNIVAVVSIQFGLFQIGCRLGRAASLCEIAKHPLVGVSAPANNCTIPYGVEVKPPWEVACKCCVGFLFAPVRLFF